jgi:hypothetical protein
LGFKAARNMRHRLITRSAVEFAGLTAWLAAWCCSGAGPAAIAPNSFPVSTNVTYGTNCEWVRATNQVVMCRIGQGQRTFSTNVSTVWLAPVVTNSLAFSIWTNVQARCRGKSSNRFIDADRAFTPDGSNAPPLHYDTNSALWGWRGMTAVMAYNSYQAKYQYWPWRQPWTLVTRRHAYSAGHQGQVCPPDVVATNWGLCNIWYLSADNVMHKVKIQSAISTTCFNTNFPRSAWLGDMAVCQFDRDLPASIETMPVVKSPDTKTWSYSGRLRLIMDVHQPDPCSAWVPVFLTDQHAVLWMTAAGIWPSWPWWKGGDSGSPQLIPMPDGRLVLQGGTSGTVNSIVMQEFVDKLCLATGLDTNRYRIETVELK